MPDIPAHGPPEKLPSPALSRASEALPSHCRPYDRLAVNFLAESAHLRGASGTACRSEACLRREIILPSAAGLGTNEVMRRRESKIWYT